MSEITKGAIAIAAFTAILGVVAHFDDDIREKAQANRQAIEAEKAAESKRRHERRVERRNRRRKAYEDRRAECDALIFAADMIRIRAKSESRNMSEAEYIVFRRTNGKAIRCLRNLSR